MRPASRSKGRRSSPSWTDTVPTTGSRTCSVTRCFTRYRFGLVPMGGGEPIVYPASAQTLRLSLIHPDYVSGGSPTMAGHGLRHPQIGLLRDQLDHQVMTKGIKLSGRVVNLEGKPIAGDRVTESSDGMSFLTYVRHTETDADGGFHFHFDPNEKVTLTVQVKGYEPATKSLVVRPGIEPIEFHLDAGKVIHGRVVNLEGKPIPAANILIPRFSSHQGVFLRIWTDSRADSAGIVVPPKPSSFRSARMDMFGWSELHSFPRAGDRGHIETGTLCYSDRA